jgi:hypothetical protein
MVVMPLWSMTVVANAALVETCIRYDVALFAAFQLNAGVVETPAVVLVGEINVGIAGAATTVVKLHTLDHPLVPPTFAALTRQ